MQPTNQKRHWWRPNHSYLVASYVKFIECAGGRCIPVPYDAPKDELFKLFKSVNGLLFTGGGLELKSGETYYDTSKYLWDLAMEANAKGDYFPLWGTCQGFQLFHVLIANKPDEYMVVENYDAWDVSWALDWVPENIKKSRMLQGVDQQVINDLGTLDITMNYHHLGVHPNMYDKYPELKEQLNVLATGTDRNKKPFIALIEGKNLPIYGAQFHPERPQYEWGVSACPHSEEAIRANMIFANFFVRECRKNTHAFADKNEEDAHLIYRWGSHLHYTEKYGDTQTYYWLDVAIKNKEYLL
jgi:gamma-glutamyl hydrolase